MRKIWLTSVLAAWLLTACGGDATPAEEAADTTRIVTLSGDLTEILFELGLGEQIVGVDVTTVWPDDALSLPIVGVGRFITAEAVLRERPTLVLADTQSGPSAALDQMRQAGVDVRVLEVATSFEALYSKIRHIGSIVGAEAEAGDLAARIEVEVEEATSGVDTTGLRVAFIYTRGPDVMLLFGDGMVTRPIIEAAGAVDAGSDAGIQGSVPVTAETLVRAAPDILIVPEEGLSITGGVEAFLTRPGVGQTPAGRSRSILSYPEGDFLTFGPRVAASLRLLIGDLEALAR